MGSKKLTGAMLLGFVLAAALVTGGCSQESKPGGRDGQVSAADQQLYTCGMHPNVIQEEPGNCPICEMDLVPIVQMSSAAPAPSSDQGERKILYWRAPMDPTYISPVPGTSPMGMDLVPVYEGEEAFGATVRINPVVEQNMGVRTAPVERRTLHQKIRTVGRIDYNESKVAHIHTKFTGWIERTYVNTTGQRVKKGEALLEIYSPQLVTAQEEYLDAWNNINRLKESSGGGARANLTSIMASAKRRLEYFDVSKAQIERLTRTGEVKKTLVVTTPFGGIVVEKHALDGMEVKSGMNLYTIADLSEIWVYADIYEYEVPWVKEGQTVRMTLSYDPGRVYTGTVQYVYPYLEEKTRTIKVRLTFANPNLDLKPGMYTNVEI
ncbi:MAG: efflux RND transporter periplasmic adaptor subunit, partial [Candidatus Marinimicrobia bacterium]|nr:efflux RND transporter periplasmic adaptor subunit [Candidatus Neomarinimicrobiota bacterium]